MGFKKRMQSSEIKQTKVSKRVLIFGAGAIGRGFLGPLFHQNDYLINFVDKDSELISKLRIRGTLLCCFYRCIRI